MDIAQLVRTTSKAKQIGNRGRGLLNILVACAVVACFLGTALTAHAQIIIEDRFDDLDRDNDGFTDDGNNTPVGVNDGISWFAINGLINFGVGPEHMTEFSVVDDTGTDINGFEGIGTGPALSVVPFGQNADFGGFFNQTIQLGPNLGDKLRLSFDYRIMDTLLAPFNFRRTMRFGLWQDTDNQLGEESLENDNQTVTVWGETDGWYEDCSRPIGTCGDYGVWTVLQSSTTETAPKDYDNYRIIEEINENISLGGSGDSELVADTTGDEREAMSVLNNEPHNISLTLERVAPDISGQDINYEVAIDGIGFGNQPLNPGPNGSGIYEARDSFDYFLMTHNVGVPEYRIDNFVVELIAGAPSGESADFDGDSDVDGADFLLWQRGFGTTDAVAGDGDANGDGAVDGEDLAVWQSQYGLPPIVAASRAVPEPQAIMLAVVGAMLCGGLRSRRL